LKLTVWNVLNGMQYCIFNFY